MKNYQQKQYILSGHSLRYLTFVKIFLFLLMQMYFPAASPLNLTASLDILSITKIAEIEAEKQTLKKISKEKD